MSLLSAVKNLLAPPPAPPCNAIHAATGEAGEVLRALRAVIDPEMGIDIVRLGLVRAVEIDGDIARVAIAPTTAGCPLAGWLVRASVEALEGIGFAAEIDVVTDPPWTPGDMETLP